MTPTAVVTGIASTMRASLLLLLLLPLLPGASLSRMPVINRAAAAARDCPQPPCPTTPSTADCTWKYYTQPLSHFAEGSTQGPSARPFVFDLLRGQCGFVSVRADRLVQCVQDACNPVLTVNAHASQPIMQPVNRSAQCAAA